MADEDSENMTAGEFLKQFRQRTGKTQKDIAEEMGLSVQAVSQWELDDRNVPRARIHDVALAYGMAEKEEHEFAELRNNPEKLTEQTPSEYRVFYGLMMLPKKTRERVIKAMRAYESASEEE